VPLEQLTDAAFQALADGFPENGALRRLAWSPGSRHPVTWDTESEQGKDDTR